MTGPSTPLLPGSCDCHAHFFERSAKYPFVPERSYTPEPASREDYFELLAALGFERCVLVQPSVYGTDNSLMLDRLADSAVEHRCIVVAEPDYLERNLDALHARGVRGVRFNVLFGGGLPPFKLQRTAQVIARRGWHIQLLVDVTDLGDYAAILGELPVELVFDHLGHLPAGSSTNHTGFERMLELCEANRAWVKISGLYRISSGAPPYRDCAPLVEALLSRSAGRALWGTDWPHPSPGGTAPAPAQLSELLDFWLPDPDIRRKVLVENPAKLYGFPAAGA